MIFLFSHLINLTLIFFYAKSKSNPYIKIIIFPVLVFTISFLSSFQFEAGTDYRTYFDIFMGEKNLGLYFHKREYAFFFLVSFLRNFVFEPQSLFIVISLIQGFLICNIMRVVSGQGFNLVLLFFLVFFISNMLHNQMNLLRAYVAVYSFVNAFLYRSEGHYKKSFLFFVFGCLWHQSIVFFVPLLFFGRWFYSWIFDNKIKVYIFTLMIFILGIPLYFADSFVSIFFPHYYHYFESEYAKKSIAYVNIVTKLIYLPLHILFFYLSRKLSSSYFSNMEVCLLGFWVLTANVFILLLYTSLVSRFLHFFAFFSIIPIYYLFVWNKSNILLSFLLFMYIILPYIAKVVVFSAGEYSYNSIFN